MLQRVPASAVLLTALALMVVSGGDLHSYATSGHKWGTTSVSYYVNPQSIYVSSSAAISAVQTGAARSEDDGGNSCRAQDGGVRPERHPRPRGWTTHSFRRVRQLLGQW